MTPNGIGLWLERIFMVIPVEDSWPVDTIDQERVGRRQTKEMSLMHGYGSMWPMGGMMVGWLLLTVLLIGLVVWLAASYARPGLASGEDTARRNLADRYARGELDTDEYTQRLSALR